MQTAACTQAYLLNVNQDVKMPRQQMEMISFMKNLGLMGAMLFIMANGSGPMSLDNRLAAARGESASASP